MKEIFIPDKGTESTPFRIPTQSLASSLALPPNTEPYTLTTEAAAVRYSVSKRTLSIWRTKGMPYLLPGPRKVLYITSDTDEWVRTKFAVGRPKPTLRQIIEDTGSKATRGEA
jgi:hypothetical protein